MEQLFFNRKNNYTLRKMTIGLCSVFIGFCFLGSKASAQELADADQIDKVKIIDSFLETKPKDVSEPFIPLPAEETIEKPLSSSEIQEPHSTFSTTGKTVENTELEKNTNQPISNPSHLEGITNIQGYENEAIPNNYNSEPSNPNTNSGLSSEELSTLENTELFLKPQNVTANKIKAEIDQASDSPKNRSRRATPEEPIEPKGAIPNAAQLKYQKEELAAFIHFGPNTFNEIEWGEHYGSREPREIFKLKEEFDAETLIRTLKEAGFKKVIVTAKHHDGFAIWNSQYTDYDIANTDYKQGAGDILAEISTAASKYNIDMGLYLSPWDIHDTSYGYRDAQGNALVGSDGQPINNMTWEEVEEKDVFDYNDFYDNQLREILRNKKYGNKGRFTEIWMDGAKGSGTAVQHYDFKRWFETIQSLQGKAAGYDSDVLLFGSADRTTVRWIGNEHGHAPETNWAPVKRIINSDGKPDIDSNLYDGYSRGFEDGEQWTVPEADARITSGWFWGKHKKTPKSMQELADMYFKSVGRNATLLLNIPPNDKGKIDEAILERVQKFGQAIRETFQTNLAEHATITATSERNDFYRATNVLDKNHDTHWSPQAGQTNGKLILDLGESKEFDVVSIEEAIQLGQRINHYTIKTSSDNQNWNLFEEGTTIGSKRLVRKEPIQARYISIEVSTTNSVPVLNEVGIYKTSDDFSLVKRLPQYISIIDNTDSSTGNGIGFSNSWNQETGSQYLNGTNMWAGPDQTTTLSFEGSYAQIIGTIDPNHGKIRIRLDDGEPIIVETSGKSRQVGQLLYETPALKHGRHTISLTILNKAAGIEGAYILNNQEQGMFEIEYSKYTMQEDDTLDMLVKRVGGSKGEATVVVENNPGSAVQSEYDTDSGGTLLFKNGETQKTVRIRSKRQLKKTGDTSFTMNLVSPTGASIGFKQKATIVIKDAEEVDLETLKTLLAEAKTLPLDSYQSGVKALQNEITASEKLLITHSAPIDNSQLAKQIDKLRQAMEHLVSRTQYTKDSPFIFPNTLNQSKILEMEFASELNDQHGGPWPLQVEEADWASNHKFLNSLNIDDTVLYPYSLEKIGVYEVIATYRSGSPANVIAWEDDSNHILAGSISAGATDASETKTVSFDLIAISPGTGNLIFKGIQGNSPQLDKLTIRLKEIPAIAEETTYTPGLPAPEEQSGNNHKGETTPSDDKDKKQKSDTPITNHKEEKYVPVKTAGSLNKETIYKDPLIVLHKVSQNNTSDKGNIPPRDDRDHNFENKKEKSLPQTGTNHQSFILLGILGLVGFLFSRVRRDSSFLQSKKQ